MVKDLKKPTQSAHPCIRARHILSPPKVRAPNPANQGGALFDMIMHDYDICSKIMIKEIYIFTRTWFLKTS
jgi:hypothetical protein